MLLQAWRKGEVSAPVVLAGDVHSSWAAELRRDFDDPTSDRIGTEFVGAGVASDGSLLEGVVPVLRAGNNDHIRHAEAGHRGWILHELNDERWTAHYRLVDDHLDAESTVTEDAVVTLSPDGTLSVG